MARISLRNGVALALLSLLSQCLLAQGMSLVFLNSRAVFVMLDRTGSCTNLALIFLRHELRECSDALIARIGKPFKISTGSYIVSGYHSFEFPRPKVILVCP